MSWIVLLDTGPLGLLAQPRPTPESLLCRQWANEVQAAGSLIHIGEVADYEVRRELLRARKTRSVARLNELKIEFGYVEITTETMLLAAEFWARLRQQGQPTADNAALDGDVIAVGEHDQRNVAPRGPRGDMEKLAHHLRGKPGPPASRRPLGRAEYHLLYNGRNLDAKEGGGGRNGKGGCPLSTIRGERGGRTPAMGE